MYSGGIGSWYTAKRVIKEHGPEDVICLFTDTLIEDDDLYRFLLETTQVMFNLDHRTYLKRLKSIPPISHKTMDERKKFLMNLGRKVSNEDHFIWLSDGRDPWDVFKDARFIGNSRIAQCSHELKQNQSREWILSNYSPEECIVYLGIDWTEMHRAKKALKQWKPYNASFPLCTDPLVTKVEMIKLLEKTDIAVPKLYGLKYEHNNCGGACVRGGQGQFINLLRNNRQLYLYHEDKEQEMIKFLGKDVSILTRKVNKKKETLTLRKLREEFESGNVNGIDFNDIGGCGCFVDGE